jgi:hypothetical protein
MTPFMHRRAARLRPQPDPQDVGHGTPNAQSAKSDSSLPSRLLLWIALTSGLLLAACGGRSFDGNSCEHRGETLRQGDSVIVDCRQCTCETGELNCQAVEDGDCADAGAPPANGACDLGAGEFLAEGDSVKQDCGTCECQGGELECDEDCAAKTWRRDGKSYADGDEVPSDMDCESCTCDDGQILCLGIGCDNSCEFRGETYKNRERFGECEQCLCADGDVVCDDTDCSSGGCIQGGLEYDDGADVPGPRDCDSCWCDEGEILCVSIGCDESVCAVGGVEYGDGEMVPSADCNSCSCNKGVVSCTEMDCPEECDVDGRVYKTGESVPSEDPCEKCECSSGRVLCEDVACIVDPECRDDSGDVLPDGAPVEVAGQQCVCSQGRVNCAPPEGSCEVRGVRYADGDPVPDADSCNTCTCADGALTGCTEIDCPVRQIAPCDSADVEDFAYDAVSIDNGYLTFDVSYGGGCETHVFDLCYEPVADGEAVAHLSHDDGGDACDALIMESLVFDLYPLAAEGHTDVFLRLSADSVLYRYP